ncbi:hypothetical protein BY996DRAFT_6410396 [Phakopsora pachyrhizi]|nr:hypothetical protein BY996DRAFT_6410396 [Phakopsora pachyrhizi]
MLGRGLVDRIEGCVSTGKEANVYHALATIDPWSGKSLERPMSLALKIYKTSILIFKDRDRYVTGIQTLGLKRTFEFVTQNKTSNETEEELIRDVSKILNSLKETASTEEAVEECGNNPNDGGNEEGLTPSNSKHEEAVFKKSFIPRTLNEVYDAERDVLRVIRGEAKDLIYANLTGIVSKQDVRVIESETSLIEELNETAKALNSEPGDDSSLSSKSDKSLNNENFSEEDEDGLLLEDELKRRDRVNRGFKFESNEDKRERKKLVKESNRLKRQEKIPKSVKKKKISKTSGKR